MTWRRPAPSKYDAAWKLIREGWRIVDAYKNAIGLFEKRRSTAPYQTRVLPPETFAAFHRMTGEAAAEPEFRSYRNPPLQQMPRTRQSGPAVAAWQAAHNTGPYGSLGPSKKKRRP